jgi:O-antigen/teichoic acid export membrane protein
MINLRSKYPSKGLRKGSWALLDQSLSSVTNLALSVVIAHESSRRGFGAFTLAFSFYVIALALYRAISTTPLMIRFSARPASELNAQAPACLGLTLMVSVGCAFALIVPGLAISGPVKPYFIVMGCCLPGLLLQDCWRMQMYAAGQPARAALLDAGWAALQIISYATLFSLHTPSAWYLGAWGISAALSGLTYSFWRRTWPSFRRGRQYFHDHRSLALNLAGEQASYIGATNIIPYLLTDIIGLVGVGALRAAQIILGFLNIPLQGLTPLLTRHAVRLQHEGPSRLLRFLVLGAAAGSLLIVSYGAAMLALPADIGTLLVGPNWRSARPLLAATTIMVLAQWLVVGAFIGLRARAEAQTSFYLRLIGSLLLLMAAPIGALMVGTQGAANGMAIASVLAAGLAWAVIIPRAKGTQAASSAPLAVDDLGV